MEKGWLRRLDDYLEVMISYRQLNTELIEGNRAVEELWNPSGTEFPILSPFACSTKTETPNIEFVSIFGDLFQVEYYISAENSETDVHAHAVAFWIRRQREGTGEITHRLFEDLRIAIANQLK